MRIIRYFGPMSLMTYLPRNRIATLILIIFFVILILVYYQLVFITGPVVTGEILKEQISKQTDYAYQADFDQVDLSLFTKKLEVTNFTLKPSNNLPDSVRRLYELYIPTLEIRVESIFKIYLHRELRLQSISVIDPSIKLMRMSQSGKKSTFSIETGDLYKIINKYLFKFSIGELKMKNASFEYEHKRKEDSLKLFLDEIDFNIDNFLIDSLHTNDQLLSTEDIKLIITNESFNLPDSIHRLSFDTFSVSTKTQNVLFKNLKVNAIEGQSSKTLNRYNIELSELNFRGIDFNKAYSDNELHLDSVRLLNPKISIKHFPNGKNRSKQKDLPAMITQLFDKVAIDQFFLDNASVSYQFFLDSTNSYKFLSKDLSLEINQFELDSVNVNFNDRFSYFKHARLQSMDFNVLFPDSTHAVSFSKMYLSTKDSIFSIHALRFTQLKNTQQNFTTATIPTLHLEGIDFAKTWFFKEATAKKLILQEPELNLKLTLKDQHFALPNIFEHIHIANIHLVDANFAIDIDQKHLTTKDLGFSLQNFSLKMDSQGQFNFVDTLSVRQLTALTTTITEHGTGVHFGQLNAMNNLQSIHLSDLRYEQGGAFPVQVDTLHLNGFNFNSYRYKHLLEFDSLEIIRPLLEITPQPDKVLNVSMFKQLAQLLSFQQVIISEGSIRLHHNETNSSEMEHISMTVKQFDYDSLLQEYFTDVEFIVDTFHLALPNIQHIISGTTLFVSQKDSLVNLSSLTVHPIDTNRLDSRYQIKTKELSLKQVCIHELMNAGKFHFNDGLLKSPNIQINLTKDTTKPDKTWLQNTIDFHTFDILDGDILLVLENSETGIEAHGLNAQATDFDLSDTSRLFFARNYLIDAKTLSIATPALSDTIRTGLIRVNTQNGNFNIEDIHITQINEANMTIPNLELKGFEIMEFIDHNHLQMDSLIIQKPKANFGLSGSTKGVPKQTIPTISIQHVGITDAYVGLYHANYNQQDSIELSNVQLQMDGVNYQPNSSTNTKALETLSFSGENFHYILDDSLYTIQVGKYRYSHPTMTISLEDIAVEPTYNRGEFQRYTLYQKDWFDATLQRLKISGFKIDSLVSNNTFLAQKIDFDTLHLDTHRDKRLPRKLDEYKPLPQSLLKSLPFGLCIDTMAFRKSYISHSEFSEQGELPGTIFFQDIDAQLLNISNRTTHDSINQFMNFHAFGKLMNTGNFMVDANFYLNHPEDRYTMEGTIGNMDLTEMNSFLEFTALVQVKEGINKMVRFNFDANEDYSIGKMIFYYDDLKISILNQGTYESKGLGNSLKSFFANTFVVNTRNPHFIFVRKGDIFHERDQSKSIFNYWGKSILSGIVSSIGAKNNMKKIKKQNEQVRAKYEELNIH